MSESIGYIFSHLLSISLKVVYYSAYIWVPVLLGILVWELWVQYRRSIFFAKQTYVLLEIKIPKELFKSPQAAEFFITGLWSTLGEGNWYEKYWLGSVRIWHSLEIVSIEGAVHFFIWTRKGARNQIEANLYSQYPGIEIYDVPDYTLPVAYDPDKNEIMAMEFDLTEKDYFPIKTYIDYGMEKNPEEEYKIDPLTPLIEAMGSLGKGQQAWFQIIITAHKKEDKDPKTGEPADMRWKKGAQSAIDEITAKSKGEKDKDGKPVPGTGRFMTEGENKTVASIERSVSKNGFDVGMRLMYIAEKDFMVKENYGGLVGGILHFNSPLNGFKPARGVPAGNYTHTLLLWKKRPTEKINIVKRELLEAYKRRAYFYKPFKKPHFVLNTEELATMFHFPGSVSTTPTFSRIESRKAEAPSNLPV